MFCDSSTIETSIRKDRHGLPHTAKHSDHAQLVAREGSACLYVRGTSYYAQSSVGKEATRGGTSNVSGEPHRVDARLVKLDDMVLVEGIEGRSSHPGLNLLVLRRGDLGPHWVRTYDTYNSATAAEEMNRDLEKHVFHCRSPDCMAPEDHIVVITSQ